MSEKTPGVSNSLSDGSEPSMEDILASIRKIIADDEGNEVPLELEGSLQNGAEAITAEIVETADTISLDVIEETKPISIGEEDELMDSLMSEIGLMDSDPAAPVIEDSLSAADDILDLELIIEDDEILSLSESKPVESINEQLAELKTEDDALNSLLDELAHDSPAAEGMKNEASDGTIDSLLEEIELDNDTDLKTQPSDDLDALLDDLPEASNADMVVVPNSDADAEFDNLLEELTLSDDEGAEVVKPASGDDIDVLLNDLLSDNKENHSIDEVMNAEPLEVAPLEQADDDLASLLDDLTDHDNSASDLVLSQGVPEQSLDDVDDIDALLNDLLDGGSPSQSAEMIALDNEAETANLEMVIDPAEDLLNEESAADDTDLDALLLDDMISDDNPNSLSANSDMDLVKSLLADLTGEPLHSETDMPLEQDLEETAIVEYSMMEKVPVETDTASVGQDDDIFAALGIDAAEDEVSEVDTSDVTTDDVMDEILSLTLDDEVEIQADAVEAAGIEVPLSLKDIAAQAQADADAMDEGKALAAIAALGAAAAAVKADTVEAVNATEDGAEENLAEDLNDSVSDSSEMDGSDDVNTILAQLDDAMEMPAKTQAVTKTEITVEEIVVQDTQDLTPDEETPDMAQAKKTDAIIDGVTETATAGAFASLNEIVEEKAVVAERGDRIGDLVQEALRPMLKEWLDKNLKGIVERAVTKEVKRISSGK